MLLSMQTIRFSHHRGRRRVPVLDAFDLAIAHHEHIALLGESGSGKSTILGLASGLLVPDSGTVTLAGCDLGALSVGARANLRLNVVGHIHQDFRLFDKLTAEENVAFVLRLRGVAAAEALQRARKALAQVEL